MTHKIAHFRRAMTAIAAVLAVTSPSFAQESTPPDPVADTAAETTPAVDPLAPDPSAETAVAPAAPKPKVETARTTAKTAKATASTTRPTARKTSSTAAAAAPAVVPAAPAEAAPPASPPSNIPVPAAAEPAPPTIAAPVSASSKAGQLDTLMSDDMVLAGLGAGALGLIALGGAGIALRRRKRRRDEAEFEARQQFLDSAEDDQPALEAARVNSSASGPAFARRTAPVHDSVPAAAGTSDLEETRIPEKGNRESGSDAQFLFRRAAKQPVEQD